MKTALIIGSTGLVGSQLLDLLLESNDYKNVIAFTKRDMNINHPKLVQHIIDFDKPESYKHLVIGDDFFCCIGTTIKVAGSQKAFRKVDFEYPKQFALYALENKVEQFLLISALGAKANSSNFYLKTKAEIENFLKECTFESVAVLRPSLLLGDRSQFRFAEKMGAYFMKVFSFVFVGKLKKFKAIESKVLAKALLNVANTTRKGIVIYESDEIQEIGK
ncbi:uncharacterized protein YbjT (DUF2867 family) [Flavobacterium sp. PL11]|uniref:oxidoreductase n=1 Tax=Flavobacterium sp. PL11 TaxID=3071717 RepID=UPI002E0AF0AC|nr:uncharacterized protein YbjT (DUF2867 family) [Flavobacterium sp. PL11]